MKKIKFYKTNEAFGFLSNFAPYSIYVDGQSWPSSEHYFQASKFDDDGIKTKVRMIESAMKAANEGRKLSNTIRNDWDLIKDNVMRRAIRAKFLQHHDIKVKLLSTKDDILIEHTINDSYWGDGGDGSGKNMLGVLLMELRITINDICTIDEWVFPPWVSFPGIEPYDMFWRMGLGEDYMYTWAKWFNNQDSHIQEQYKIHFPSNLEWDDFYG